MIKPNEVKTETIIKWLREHNRCATPFIRISGGVMNEYVAVEELASRLEQALIRLSELERGIADGTVIINAVHCENCTWRIDEILICEHDNGLPHPDDGEYCSWGIARGSEAEQALKEGEG